MLMRIAYDYATKESLYNGDFEHFVNLCQLHVDHSGKPYLSGLSLDFSISHSGSYWACVFSHKRCGLDIQETRKINYEAIAKRFYSPDEISYVMKTGASGFFDIWVRREAYGKMTGEGFFCNPPSFADKGNKLHRTVKYQRKNYYLIEPDFRGAVSLIEDGFPDNYKIAICLSDDECDVIEF